MVKTGGHLHKNVPYHLHYEHFMLPSSFLGFLLSLILYFCLAASILKKRSSASCWCSCIISKVLERKPLFLLLFILFPILKDNILSFLSDPFSFNVGWSFLLEFSSSDVPSTAALEVEPCNELHQAKSCIHQEQGLLLDNFKENYTQFNVLVNCRKSWLP